MKIESYHRQNIIFQNFTRQFLSIGDEELDFTREIGLWTNNLKYLNSYDGGKTYISEDAFILLSHCGFYLSYERKDNIMKINNIL